MTVSSSDISKFLTQVRVGSMHIIEAIPPEHFKVLLGLRDQVGRTPLMIAAAYSHIALANLLILRGASLDEVDLSGVSAAEYLRNPGTGTRADVFRMSMDRAERAEAIAQALEGALTEHLQDITRTDVL